MKIAREKAMIADMIRLYCRKKHGGGRAPCGGCE
jgi:hypothetical protein